MKKKITKSLFAGLVFLALGFLGLGSFAQNKVKIAVMDFKAAIGVSNEQVIGLSDMLINSLYETGTFDIIERYQLDKVLQEQGFQASSMTTEQVVKVGKILGVGHILVGTVNLVMGEYNIDVRIVSAESGRIVSTAGTTKTASTTIRDMMSDLGKQIAGKLENGLAISSNLDAKMTHEQVEEKILEYCKAENYEEAVRLSKKYAEIGYPIAQYLLASLYEQGKVDGYKNIALAFNWFNKAAQQGHIESEYKIGCAYANGDVVEKNEFEAVKWFRRAAEQGYVDAQYNLGNCYYLGKGVTKDYAEAVKWIRRAAEQGHVGAQHNLGNCYSVGEGVTKDYAEAVKWTRRAAEQGHVGAQYSLGYCYSVGKGVTKDYAEAVKWWRKAAEQGDASAQYRLGDCYYFGKGVTEDYAEARYWFQKAAEQGHGDAKRMLQ